MRKKLGQAKKWYTNLPVQQQVVYAAAALIFLLILTNLAVTGYVWFESAKEGLSIHLEPEHRTVQVPHNTNQTIAFSLGINNAPFCQATCTYTVVDHATKQSIGSGEASFSSAATREQTITYQAPSSGRYTTPIQINVACTNQETALCQRAGDTSYASTTVATTITFSEENQALFEELQNNLSEYNQASQQVTQQLAGISAVNDTRAQQVTRQASNQLTQQQEHHQALTLAAQQDELVRVEELLANTPSSNAINEYEELVMLERRASNEYEELLAQTNTINALLSTANTSEEALLAQQGRAARIAQEEFATQDIATSARAINEFLATTQALQQQKNATIHQQARQAQTHLYQETTMTCLIKNTSCPPTSTPPQTLAQAVSTWSSTCQELNNLQDVFSDAQRSMQEQLYPGDEASAQQTISDVRAQTTYEQTARSIRADARNNTLTETNQTLLLAVELQVSNQTKQFVDNHCPVPNRSLDLPTPAPTPSLPTNPTTNTTQPLIAFAHAQCCNQVTCTQCGQPRQAILFVHGHAFAETAVPESSLQAFERLARALQENDVAYYAGRIYSQQEHQPSLTTIPGTISLSTTYYYNSYAEQGQTLLVTQKNFNIETFALRLREAIDATRAATGAEQVTIVAHSMGGLVTRSYLDIFGDDHVNAVVTIGTPNQGITGRTARICPLIGGALSCEDMRAGSVFLRRLPPQTGVPTLTIAGIGCEERDYDGVIEASSVELAGARNEQITGVCDGTRRVLHGDLLRPHRHPEVLALIQEFLNET